MARLLAIEWDDREVRVAVATPRGSEVIVEEAFAIDISAAAATDTTTMRGRWDGASRKYWPSAAHGERCAVGLGRTSIELPRCRCRRRSRRSARHGPLSGDAGVHHDRRGLAARLRRTRTPRRIAQRAGGRRVPEAGRPDPAGVRGQPAQAALPGPAAIRRRIPAEPQPDIGRRPQRARRGLAGGWCGPDGHFRRSSRLHAHGARLRPTTAGAGVRPAGRSAAHDRAAQAQMGGQRIEQIIICGGPAEHPVLAQSLSEALSLEVVAFDPFQVVRLARSVWKQQLPADSGRYAPLPGYAGR